jgi:hypothetical protein
VWLELLQQKSLVRFIRAFPQHTRTFSSAAFAEEYKQLKTCLFYITQIGELENWVGELTFLAPRVSPSVLGLYEAHIRRCPDNEP